MRQNPCELKVKKSVAWHQVFCCEIAFVFDFANNYVVEFVDYFVYFFFFGIDKVVEQGSHCSSGGIISCVEKGFAPDFPVHTYSKKLALLANALVYSYHLIIPTMYKTDQLISIV